MFENIKPGDTVYLRKHITTEWNQKEFFFIPAVVDRVTKTQFMVGKQKFYKKTGEMVGAYRERAYIPGQVDYGRTVKDESAELEEFKQRLAKTREIRAKFVRISIPAIIDSDKIDEIDRLVIRLKDLL